MNKLGDVCPAHLHVARTVVQGGAFRKPHQYEDEGEKNRFFFICNCAEKLIESKDIYTVTARSNVMARIDRCRKQNISTDTIVRLAPDNYPDIIVESALDCNSLTTFPYKALELLVAERKIATFTCLPNEILKKIWRAIWISPKLSQYQKDCILPPQERFNISSTL